MNVIDGQAGLARYFSLIFYSLTIDNILNIVVLLILAAISISMLGGENGIVKKANESKIESTHGEVTESVKLAYGDYQIQKQTSNDMDQVTFLKFLLDKEYINDEGIVNTEKLNSKKLWLGNGTGTKDVYKIEKVGTKYELNYYGKDEDVRKLWEVGNGSSIATSNKTAKDLKEGDYVIYKDKNGNEIICVVLYDNTSEYGIQIVAMDIVEDITLGGTDIDTAKESYNNAIKTLNDKSKDYLNTKYATSTRCIGSLPNDPYSENSELYTTSISYFLDYNDMFKSNDTNYKTDYDQMNKLNITNIDKEYWYASRAIYSNETQIYSGIWSLSIGVRFWKNNILYGGMISFYENCYGKNDGGEFGQISYGLRPVFTLKPELELLIGDGSESTPYRFDSVESVEELRIGDIVEYKDKSGTIRKCVVLYNSDTYGTQIITLDKVEDITLGGSDIDTVSESYNNAIKTLNDKSAEYLNEEYATSARCVGSVPNDSYSENSELYSSSYVYSLEFNNKFKSNDNNYKTDYNQMDKLNIRDLGYSYWYASRFITDTSGSSHSILGFGIEGNAIANNLSEKYLAYNYDGNLDYKSITAGLRPVFTLKNRLRIIGGIGTEEEPFKLEK